jgi:hypothetical protein
VVQVFVILVPPTFLDNLAEYVVVTGVNADGTSQAHSLEPFLFSVRNDDMT